MNLAVQLDHVVSEFSPHNTTEGSYAFRSVKVNAWEQALAYKKTTGPPTTHVWLVLLWQLVFAHGQCDTWIFVGVWPALSELQPLCIYCHLVVKTRWEECMQHKPLEFPQDPTECRLLAEAR